MPPTGNSSMTHLMSLPGNASWQLQSNMASWASTMSYKQGLSSVTKANGLYNMAYWCGKVSCREQAITHGFGSFDTE